MFLFFLLVEGATLAGAAVSQSLNHVKLELTCAHEKKSQQIKRRGKKQERRKKNAQKMKEIDR
jgi:hypothetical protein